MFKFLREDSTISSMRVSLFIGIICVAILCIGIFIYTLIHAVKCSTLDWSGMSIFLGAIAAFAGTFLYGKVQQKKVEITKPLDTVVKDGK